MTSLNLVGTTLGDFAIFNELGRGGMAVVYRAQQAAPNRMVALKVLPPELSMNVGYIARFRQEADSAAALEHPHIVPIYAMGDASGLHYIAMKLIAGRTLREVIDADGPLALPHALTLLRQIASALDYAHTQGVIHRDIKPSNVMIDSNGWVYLMDFGLARGIASNGLTVTGTVMGTPDYMSPEQAEGRATIGAASDLYALGVMLYEMLTCAMPFEAETPLGVLVARLQQAPRSPRLLLPTIDQHLEAILLKALARKPEDRFASAQELVAALQTVQAASAVPAVQAAAVPAATQAMPAYATPPAPQVPAYVAPPAYIVPAAPAPMPNTGPTMALSTPAPRRRWRKLLIGCAATVALVIALAGWATYALYDYGDQLSKIEATRALIGQPNGMAQAISGFSQLTTDHPRLAEAHANLASAYALRGRYEQAFGSADQAIGINAGNALAHAVRAEALNDSGNREQALSEAEQAVSLDKNLAYAIAVRAAIRADIAVDHADSAMLKQASSDASAAIASAGDEDALAQALAHNAMAYVHWQEDQFSPSETSLSQGIDEMNIALRLQPQLAQLHTTLGYFYNAQKDYPRARQSFESAIAADNGYAPGQAGIGWNRYSQNDNRNAIAAFDAAIALDPSLINAYIGKNYALQALEPADYANAITVLQAAVSLAPSSARLATDLGWAYRGQALRFAAGSDQQKAGYAAAEAQFRRALSIDSRFYEAGTGLGWSLQDQAVLAGDQEMLKHSVEILNQSLTAKEDQPFAHNALGWSLYHLTQYDLALAAFNRAIALRDGYADAQYGRGRVLEAQGYTAEARTAYTSAISLGSEQAKDALAGLK